jgi:hypothetical protein
MRWKNCLLVLLVAAQASEGEEWRVVAEVDEVQVRIHWVSVNELLAAAERVGKKPSGEALAFSVLRREVESGRYICDIYMPERPRHVGDRATDSLGHELGHCLGYSHE